MSELEYFGFCCFMTGYCTCILPGFLLCFPDLFKKEEIKVCKILFGLSVITIIIGVIIMYFS